MASSTDSHEIYLEAGRKKVFAVALHWPGWCRSGKDEQAALQMLIDASPRYAKIANNANLAFNAPEIPAQLTIVARLEGNATTDFGAPAMPLPQDWEPVEADELERYVRLLQACWLAFDQVVAQAEGKALQKGPRGGGRELAKIIDHVVGAEEGYLRSLGWKLRSIAGETTAERKERVRREVIQGLQAAVAGQLAREGSRGGKRWSPRYFARRLAWHVVDHVWEIEDRII
ncbi:MAG: hypothetical protein DCC55_01245 [Chloroflexi bacterium]|nr:MAG: hypothetical protein DCC55_01245 [Chloroflexota bacterium]